MHVSHPLPACQLLRGDVLVAVQEADDRQSVFWLNRTGGEIVDGLEEGVMSLIVLCKKLIGGRGNRSETRINWNIAAIVVGEIEILDTAGFGVEVDIESFVVSRRPMVSKRTDSGTSLCTVGAAEPRENLQTFNRRPVRSGEFVDIATDDPVGLDIFFDSRLQLFPPTSRYFMWWFCQVGMEEVRWDDGLAIRVSADEQVIACVVEETELRKDKVSAIRLSRL
jgi:hypothetical protein